MSPPPPNLSVLHFVDRMCLDVYRTAHGDVHAWRCDPLEICHRGPASEHQRLRATFLLEFFTRVSEGPLPRGFLSDAEERCIDAVRALDSFKLEALARNAHPEAAVLLLAVCRGRGDLGRTVFPPSRTSSPLLRDFLTVALG